MIAAIGKFFLGIFIFYAALCATLFLVQRSLIYYPDKRFPEISEREDGGFIRVATDDGLTLIGWYMPAAPGKKTILYFHGNAGHIGHRLPMVETYINEGYGVLLAEYRGYGGNPGKPSEQGFYKDARAYLDFLRAGRGVPLSDIILYGESIGSGPAVQMAFEHAGIGGLLLITPFSSALDLARRTFFFVPVEMLMRDRFDNLSKISALSLPQYYFVAGADEVIPAESSRLLYEAAPEPKFWHEFPTMTHNQIHQESLIQAVSKVLADL